MRSKRLMTILLAACMLISILSPAVSAAQFAGGSADRFVTTDKVTNDEDTSLVVSPDASSGVPTMKDGGLVSSQLETPETTGQWDITEIEDLGANLLSSDTPECLEELKEAAEYYEADEKVVAFVVMEEQPLAVTYSNILDVSVAAKNKLLNKQDAVIASIEEDVMEKDDELEVRYQFTYLTNSFSIETQFRNLEQIAMLDNVKSVFVMPYYQPITTDAVSTNKPMTASSNEMTGVGNVWEELGYTGTGMKIAVIDTGLDLDHPSFAAAPELSDSSMTAADVEAVLADLNAYKRYVGPNEETLTADNLYRTEKVPYAFNYADTNLTADHSKDNQGDHGTHVSGIAAANAVEGTSVVGMAPDAQIIVLKVFGNNPYGASADNIVAALEDAMTLGCDVVNASLGSAAGFSSTDSELDLIYKRLASCDIIATYSAGNEGTSSYGNMWGTNLNHTSNPDNATVGSPSTYVNTLSIASAENAQVMTNYFSLADGTKIMYMDSIEYLYGYTYAVGLTALAGQELEYVIVPGLGSADDFTQVDVAGKVAVVKRGELSFSEKAFNAQNNGAVACIVWNNNDEDDIFSFGMTTAADDGSYPSIPVSLVTLSDGNLMEAAETKTMTPTDEMTPRQANGGQMSSFSSWGVSPDLQLLPDITGIGGNVYSCYDGGNYGLMSGTSMSSPQVAGISALVMEYLHGKYPDAPDGSLRAMAEALLMSTADPIISTESGVEASPRQQGAGLVDAYEATTNTTYLTVGGGRPKAELGDSTSGVYTFSFELHNFGTEAETYTLSSSLLTEDVVVYGDGLYFMAGTDTALSGTVAFDKDSVTVPAGGQTNVTVTVTLSDEDKAMFNQYWENGGYVEGFVYLTNDEGAVELNLPFLGFYGDWTAAPTFDSAFWYENGFWGVTPENGYTDGEEYYHVIWTLLGATDWVLGFNPYSGAISDENGNIIYDPAHNAISPNGDGVLDGIDEIYISLLRNARTMTLTYTVDGEVMQEEVYDFVHKTMYNSNYGQIIPWYYSGYGYDMYDFTDAEGNPLPSGTEVILTVEAKLDYATDKGESFQIPFYVDNEGAKLVSVQESVMEVDGESVAAMNVEVDDNVAVAAVYLMNLSGTQIYGGAYDYQLTETENGTYIVPFDVTDLGTKLVVCVCDYAGNERYYQVTYTANGDNLPEMNTDSLYAYRVYDNYIMSDHLYGWVEMNKPASADEYANISVWSDDYLEYAAINAAEYAGGKIFAVDAVYNLSVMDPGVFSRQEITNLGINIIDMTFDDSTDTMYLLSNQSNYIFLYSLDLLTGKTTQLKYFGTYSSQYANVPWAITDDDNGTLYAIMYNSSAIYTIDPANNYTMTPVTDAEGNPIVITDSTGTAVAPSANSQSIAYLDGKLYWAYFKYSWSGETSELITIDTADWTSYANTYAATGYDADGNLVEYYPTTELVGLLTLTETDYQIPESNAPTSFTLDTDQVILGIGGTRTLSVSWMPWNYDLDTSAIVWTSSDESVATVDADGIVTGVGEGTATIQATYGDVSATCSVVVVNIEGHFEAYNYYTGDGYYGYMIDVDMETMDYTLVGDKSPVDFVAGDYNGHDGYFYGYDMGGQLYRYDYATGKATALGAPMGTYPVDMAYDYSSGLMYMLVLDYNSFQNTLYSVNMNNGAVMELATGMGLLTLACSTDGTLYAADAYGYVNQIFIQDYSDYGYGIMMEAYPVIDEPVGDVYMLASMCWDHNNDVLLWNWCDGATVLWIDPVQRYVVDLGDPSESGIVELTGMHVVPDEIPELADTAVESVTAEDMLILTGYEKVPAVTVTPFNATCQNLELTAADTGIVEVTAAGTLKGVAPGETTVTATLVDEIGEQSFEVTFNVTVMDGVDNLYGVLLGDLATSASQYWIGLNPGNPGTYEFLEYFDYTIYSEEYVDGKIYTYGYDPLAWPANYQYMILDAETYEIETMIDMGAGFPDVYDMTYDHVTSTMYVLAGASEDNTDLYVMDMDTGSLVLLMETDPLLMAIAAGPEGQLYAIEASEEIYDEWDPWAAPTVTNAKLHVIDPLEGTMELIGDTGLKNNMFCSMTYDYDTDALYWTPLASVSSYESHLAILDPETGVATSLGTIGVAGAQVGGLYTICDSYPEADNSTLHNLLITASGLTLNVGESASLESIVIPGSLDVDIVWNSENENVATVDENGVVTGVNEGQADITVTAVYNGVTKTASCHVAVLKDDASFLTYNSTDGGWAMINRNDYTQVTNLTEGEETGVVTFTHVDGQVYGYDSNNQLFKLDAETYERTPIGDGLGLEVDTENGYLFEIKDMAYDTANDRVLLLGSMMLWSDYYGKYTEIYGGWRLYTVDLTTGALEEIYAFDDAHTHIAAMTVGSEGEVYFYSTYNDVAYCLDLTTGDITNAGGLFRLSLYGDGDSDFAMYYDDLTENVYMLFTSNGNFYKMITIDTKLGTVTDNGYVGEVVKDGWYTFGDSFNGLGWVYNCEHSVTAYELIVNEDGTVTVNTVCGICGEVLDSVNGEIIDEEVTKEATCEEDGTIVYTVQLPDGSTVEVEVKIPATGHNYGDDGVCDNCGDELNPEQPTDPEDPTEPEQPTDPEDPTDPEQPTDPEDPTDPEQPTDPEDPTDPEQPTDPEDPTDPEQPTIPEDPTEEPSEDATEATKPGSNGSADTGDSALMGMWMGLLVMALSGMAVLVTARKKWMNI